MSTIKEVLDRKGNSVLTVPGSTSVLDAIGKMSGANIGAIVIQDAPVSTRLKLPLTGVSLNVSNDQLPSPSVANSYSTSATPS